MQRKDPRRLPPLERLAVFDAAARHLSFTKAGQERFLTQSSVSRQVAALEDDLGVPLFRRRHRALDLTEDGRRLASATAAALAGLREAVAEIRAPQRREVLALTTTPGLASLWLIPRLAGFLAAHPGVDVRIDATHEKRALAADGFDIAVRYGRIGATEGQPMFEESVQPVCAPALLRSLPLKAPADLRRHTLLQVAMPAAQGMPTEWPAWLQAAGAGDVEPAAMLTFTNYDTAVAAAVDGQGVVLGRRPLIDRLLRQKKLVAPLAGQTASVRGYYLIVDPASARRPAAQALAAWLLEQARQPD
ncbi:MAG: LysR family transcriptional regulator [Rubrivivax sp.]|nr:LysR family transcriptional regulator [Rubrivivax sp.]